MMIKEITSAEFDYFRAERIPIEVLRQGARLLLFSCIENDELPDPRENEPFYGKIDCTLRDLYRPKTVFVDTLPFFISVHLHDDETASVGLTHHQDNIFTASGPDSCNTLANAFGLTQVTNQFGILDYRVHLSSGYLVDAEHSDNPLLTDMLAKGRNNNDGGTAESLVPSHPRSPQPTIGLELS